VNYYPARPYDQLILGPYTGPKSLKSLILIERLRLSFAKLLSHFARNPTCKYSERAGTAAEVGKAESAAKY
jgi:hypothetical protein